MIKIFIPHIAIVTLFFLNGCATTSAPTKESITKKIIKIETSTGSYTTVNKKSGAYGRYQIMPKTAKHYTRKLKIKHKKWKTPYNQNKIYAAILDDNIKSLKSSGLDVNTFNVYGCHQQGAYGFKCIMENKNLTSRSYMRLRANLPKKYRYARNNQQLRTNWINYWKEKTK